MEGFEAGEGSRGVPEHRGAHCFEWFGGVKACF